MTSLRFLILSSVCVAGLVSACGSSDPPPATDAGSDVVATDVPATDAPATDAPATDVPATDVPARDVSATDVPATDVPAADVADAAVGTVFEATLSGAQEVPSVASAATGTATITLNMARTEISYVVRHTLMGATAAHIHGAAPGVNGGVVVTFPSAGAEITGTAALTPSQVADLEAGALYINIHSMAHPGGEIRGQILRRGEELFVTPLTGVQEVPRVVTSATGTASVILNPATSAIRYRMTTTLMPSAAHIHRGIAGVSGPVVYPLTPNGSTIVGTQTVTPTDIAELRGGRFYVNVHTAANPGGEIRGQLLAPGAQLFVANLTGGQEVPPVTTVSTGSAMVVLNYARDSVSTTVATTAMGNAAHLHRGPGAVNGPVVVPLAAEGGFFTATAAITPPDAALLETGGIYVNVHTTANPGGEVRGQVLRPGEVLYTARLSGLSEVPPVVTMATGSAAMILNPAGDLLTYTGVLAGFTPTAAHIHTGAVGVSGGVVHTLMFTSTSLGGTQAVSGMDVQRLNAAGYYVNVHSMAHPGGEIRGQIMRQ